MKQNKRDKRNNNKPRFRFHWSSKNLKFRCKAKIEVCQLRLFTWRTLLISLITILLVNFPALIDSLQVANQVVSTLAP